MTEKQYFLFFFSGFMIRLEFDYILIENLYYSMKNLSIKSYKLIKISKFQRKIITIVNRFEIKIILKA